MATRYVDGTLAGTTATYNPATRSSTGGSDDGYKTLTDALAAATAADDIFLRSGECDDLSSGYTISDYTIEPYQNETAFITVRDGTFDVVTLLTGNLAFGKLGNCIELRGGGDNNISNDAVFINGNNLNVYVNIMDFTGRPLRTTGATGGHEGELILTRCVRCINFGNTGADSNWDCIQGIDCSSVGGSAVIDVTGSGVHNVTEGLVVGGGTVSAGNASIRCNAGSLTFTTLNVVGFGRDGTTQVSIAETGTGTLTVNGGTICGNINDPLQSVYLGTPTFGPSVKFNEYVQVPNAVGGSSKASFMAWDSNHSESNGSTTSLNDWVSAFDATGKKFIYCPDDSGQLTAEKITNIQSFLSSGHELGAESESSTAFDLATDATNQPFEVYYTGVATTVDIIVDTDASSPTLVVEVDSVAELTINLLDNPNPALLMGNDNPALTGTNYLFDTLNGATAGAVTLTCVALTPYNDSLYENMWDDTSTLALKSDTYAIGSSAGTATPIEVDRTKWFNIDVDQNRATLQSLFPTAVLKTFVNYKLLTVPADATSAILSGGFENIFAGITSRTGPNPNGVSEFAPVNDLLVLSSEREAVDVRGDSVQSGISFKGNTNVNYVKGAADNEWNIRAWVASICSYCYAYGLYPVVELPRKTNTFAAGTPTQYVYSDDDIAWMVEEFESNGFAITIEEDEPVQPPATAVTRSMRVGVSGKKQGATDAFIETIVAQLPLVANTAEQSLPITLPENASLVDCKVNIVSDSTSGTIQEVSVGITGNPAKYLSGESTSTLGFKGNFTPTVENGGVTLAYQWGSADIVGADVELILTYIGNE